MRRTVLDFSVRIDAEMPLREMHLLVERALGCTLVEVNYHGIPVLMAELLGMKILFSGWRGLNRKETFQLHGGVDDVRFLDERLVEDDSGVIGIDINQAILDLLAVHGAGEWRVPSRAELEAEVQYGDEVERAFRTPEGGPRFGPEDEDEG